MEASLPVARMPAEWEPHARCWMAWPDGAVWEDELAPVEREYAAVAQAISAFEPVSMIANPASASRARAHLGTHIDILELPIDDAWLRDSGPTFVHLTDGSVAGVCWRFNGWGGANPDFQRDAALARHLLSALGLPAVTSALAMEGGALAVDGAGTLLTTESVVLNANRNPGITRDAAAAEFARTLGATTTIWLPGDAAEFGTNGHIDGIACFSARGRVLFETSEGARKAVARENLAALTRSASLQVDFLTEAPATGTGMGDWGFCTSYVNFYVANGGIVAPSYGIPEDKAAKEVLRRAFPGRQVVQVDISHIAAGGGGIHCITQQQPMPGC